MRKRSIFALGALLIFVAFTYFVMTFDVQPIGPLNSEVGFAGFNAKVVNSLGQSEIWYTVTEILGNLSFLVVAGFAITGLCQLIRHKSLGGVDISIWMLGVFYILVVGAYVLFEFFVVNCRPILLDGVLEASYPSSHTMFAISVLGSAVIALGRLMKSKAIRIPLQILCVLGCFVMAVGRLLSGVHWCTDIIGGVLLSIFMILLYYNLLPSMARGKHDK